MTTAIKADAEQKQIPLKKAVQIAMRYFKDLYTFSPNAHVMLEEVEQSEDGRYWLITIGFNSERLPVKKTMADLGNIFATPATRDYKTVKIDSATGDVISMKIRSLR
jgi:hypothetical protein